MEDVEKSFRLALKIEKLLKAEAGGADCAIVADALITVLAAVVRMSDDPAITVSHAMDALVYRVRKNWSSPKKT